MKMTEKEAQGKWCPFARVLLPINQSGNRVGTFFKKFKHGPDREHYEQQEADCNCIGSRCMAWRWEQLPQRRCRMPAELKEAMSEVEPPRPTGLPETWIWSASAREEGEACWIEPQEEANGRTPGYCGLAGRAEGS